MLENSPSTLWELCNLRIRSLGLPFGKRLARGVATARSLGTHAMKISFCGCPPNSEELLPSPLQSLFALPQTTQKLAHNPFHYTNLTLIMLEPTRESSIQNQSGSCRNIQFCCNWGFEIDMWALEMIAVNISIMFQRRERWELMLIERLVWMKNAYPLGHRLNSYVNPTWDYGTKIWAKC